MRIITTVAALAMVCFIAGVSQSSEKGHWEAPQQAAARQNPLKDKTESAAGGQKLFVRNCSQCHAAGPGQKGPVLGSEKVQSQTDGALFWKISNGNSRTGMPSFSSIPEGQRWQLILYIRSLAKRP